MPLEHLLLFFMINTLNQKALVLPLNKIDVIIVWYEGLALC